MTHFVLTAYQCQVLLGTMLGDANMKKNGLVTFHISIRNKPYLEFLIKVFDGLCGKLRDDKAYLPKYDKVYYSVRVSILSKFLKSLVPIYLTSEGKKIVPCMSYLLANLSPAALAFWIMDDGKAVVDGGLTLCTDSFTPLEIQRLRDVLAKLYNLDTTLHTITRKSGKVSHRIYIRKNSAWLALIPLIVPYMHSSFLYKLNVSNQSS